MSRWSLITQVFRRPAGSRRRNRNISRRSSISSSRSSRSSRKSWRSRRSQKTGTDQQPWSGTGEARDMLPFSISCFRVARSVVHM